ncbi:hypothetical protein GCM10022631_10610 [Deinococcus rubellus]
MGILALVRNLSARRPARTESLPCPRLARMRCESTVDEFSALYTLYATGELTPGEYWQAKKALFEREATRHTLRG